MLILAWGIIGLLFLSGIVGLLVSMAAHRYNWFDEDEFGD